MGFLQSLFHHRKEAVDDDEPRFQSTEVGHIHHLTPSKMSSINGFVSGMASKSLRQWTERKISIEEIEEERMILNRHLNRNIKDTLYNKYGQCQEMIGKGTSGVVRICQIDKEGHQLYAIKELRKQTQESSKDYVNRLLAEYYIASPLKHVNLIKTYDLLPMHETSPIYCDVMEYCGGGDLFQVLLDNELVLDEAHCFFKQLIHGVHYLHSIGVAHRDLKPENLLLTVDGCLKISDFGCAVCFKGTKIDRDGTEEADDEHKVHWVKGLVGSEPYIAPEQFNEDAYDARAVDIWSCAIIYMTMRKSGHLWHIAKREDDDYDKYIRFRELLEQQRENATRNSEERNQCVLRAKETIKRKMKENGLNTFEGIDIQAKKVIYRMLDPIPTKRIKITDIVHTPWFSHIQCCQYP